MRAANALISVNELKETASAKSVRVRDGQVETTNGPFAETKEALGGYFLVERDNLDQALGYAARIPGATYGTVEVLALNEHWRTALIDRWTAARSCHTRSRSSYAPSPGAV